MTDHQFNKALEIKNKLKALKELYHWIMSEDKNSLLCHYTEIDFDCIQDDLSLAVSKIHDTLQEEFDNL